MSTLTHGRRPLAPAALLAIMAMMGALLGVSLPASADTAGNQVVTTVTTPTQTSVAPNGPLTGLQNGNVVTVNATATGISNNLIFGLEARLCRSGINIALSSQYSASSGNCIASPLAPQTSTFVQKTIGSPNTSGSINFIIGSGTETAHVGPGAPIECDQANPCSLWIHESVPTSIIASGNAYVHYDVNYTDAAPVVTTNPSSQSVASGATYSFSAAATGSPPPTVQWQVSTNGGSTFTDIAGATSTTYTATSALADNAKKFRAVFTNPAGSTSSSTATLIVGTTATTPTQTNVAPNGPLTGLRNGNVVTISAAASGVSPNLLFGLEARLCRGGYNITLSSQFSASSGNCIASPLSPQSSAFVQKTVGPPNTSASINFIVGSGTETVAAHAGPGAPIECDQANPCTLWVHESVPTALVPGGNLYLRYDVNYTDAAPVVTTNPSNQAVVAGTSYSFTAAASASPWGSVQWQVSTDAGATFTDIPGATSLTYSASSALADSGKQFQAVFTNPVGSATTSAATLFVGTGPVVTTNPSNQTVIAGGSYSFSAAATGVPSPTVQWQVSTNGGVTYSNIAGATSTTYSATSAASDNGSKFRAVFSNTTGSTTLTATTSAATLTVQTAPSVTTNPSSQTVAAGSSYSFSAAATGSPSPTVQWQLSTDGGATFTDIAGATSTTYTATAVAGDDGSQFRAVFTNAAGTATTSAATLTVQTAPSVTTNPSSQTVTAGSSYSFSAAATGSPSPTVQWQLSTDGGATFTDLAGETSTTYTATASISVDGYQFRAVFTNASGTATTSAATLTVQTVPTVSTNPSDTTVLVGTPYSFSAAGSGTPAPSVQWQLSTDGGATFTDISGATSTTYTATAVATDNGHQFRAVFTNPAGTATTTAATLTVATTATAPVITSAVAGNASVTVTWTASSPSPASYTVSSKRGTLVGPTCTTTGTSCVVSGLTNGLSYTFKVTANYGTTTTVSASSAAVIPRIITDLVAGNSAPVSAYRSGTGSGVTAGSPFTVTESVTNNGTQAAPAKMVITVTNATESSISTDPGLVCDPLTPVGAGFTQTCNVALLAPGATLSAQVSLNPQPLPPVLSLIAVKNVVSLPVTVPSTYLDPVKTNNTVAKKVKVYDRDDLVATFSGAPSVLRSGQYVASGSITNNGPDPVFGKFTITVANALEASGGFTADAGLSCAAPVVNGAGTGFSRVCTTVAPLASGGSLSVQLTLVPNPTLTVHTFTVTGAAASVGGYVVDANPLNNKQVLRVAIV